MPTKGEEKNKSDIPLLLGFHDSAATASYHRWPNLTRTF